MNRTTATMRTFLSALCLLTIAAQMRAMPDPGAGEETQSRQVLINDGWKYLEDDPATPAEALASTRRWEAVTLPHSWNVWDAVDAVPGYRRAASWYRKDIMIPAGGDDRRYLLLFEGVNITSEVYVNGVKAGGHTGGYVGFEIDITPFTARGRSNTIMVRASNAYDPDVIPSQKSDFHIYGGITRNVWLKTVPSAYLAGITVRTPRVSAAKAEVEIEAAVENTAASRKFEIEAEILDGAGKRITAQSAARTLPAGRSSVAITMPSIKKPQLWSPKNPALYTVRVAMKLGKTAVDAISDRFGCRWFEFKDHGPFYLNGERLLLRGTHRHEDIAGYASAIPDSLQRRDFVMMKEMGVNFVRLTHYPQAPAVYRACDELGILVWDELPWCRGGVGGDAWKANTRRLLREQIAQNFNHPSIFIHGLGNELYWLPDVPGGDNLDSLRAMVRDLNAIAHEMDPYRLTATRKFTEGADLVDVVSPSMWPGWYSGSYKNFEKVVTDAKHTYPHLLHVEYGGDSHVGRHTENPVNGDAVSTSDGCEENIKPQKIKNVSQYGDWSETYIVDLFDWILHCAERMDWLAGNAQWAFKDFPTPLRPENPIPYINEKGLVDRAGVPKDAYYVFKSYWTESPKFCYIESHTWTERYGPKELKREVNVFSNCQEAELFVNGVSQGKRTRDAAQYPACGLSWQVGFPEGANTIRVVGFDGAQQIAVDSMTVRYYYKRNDVPDHIVLASAPMEDGRILVTATAVDKDGRRCLDYNKRIYFTCDGDAKLYENYGTPTRSSIIEMASGQAGIELKRTGPGRAVIEARNQDFKGEYLVVTGQGQAGAEKKHQ